MEDFILIFKKNKFNLTSSLYTYNGNSYSENTTEYYYFNYNKYNRMYDKEDNNYLSVGGNIRADYRITDNHILGIVFDGLYTKKNNKESANTIYSKLSSNSLDSIYDSYNKTNTPTRRFSLNLNYRGKISEKSSFSLDVDYLTNNRDNNITNDFYRLETESVSSLQSSFEQRTNDLFDNYSTKMEYKHKFNDKQSLTTGVDFYYASSKSDFFYASLINDQYIPDPLKNNTFEYKETFVSPYVSYDWKLNNKLMGVAGVKAEYVNSKGVQKATEEKIKKNYFDIKPSLSVLYEVNSNNRLSYNFSLGVYRPGYYYLNPFKFFVNPTTYKENNPNLSTLKTYTNRLLYTFARHYTIGLNYTYTSQSVRDFYIPVDDKFTKILRTNYGNTHTISLYSEWNNSYWDERLFVKLSANVDYIRDKGKVETILVDNSFFSYSFSLNSNWTISKKRNLNLDLNSSYRSREKYASEDFNNFYYLSFGFRKVFHNDISLSFGMNGLFTPNRAIQKTDENYKYHIKLKTYNETAYIRLSIPFGNQKTKGAQNRSSSSNARSRLSE